MTSVELLERAAKVLRERANAAQLPGEWHAETNKSGHAWIGTVAEPHAWGMHGWGETAKYVQLMHPPVALALADLLDVAADNWRRIGSDYSSPEFNADELVAVARAILRESP